MKNGILIGAAFGMVIGALLVNNNRRVREMVSDTQQRVKEKMQKGCCCSDCSEQDASSRNSEFENAQSYYMN